MNDISLSLGMVNVLSIYEDKPIKPDWDEVCSKPLPIMLIKCVIASKYDT